MATDMGYFLVRIQFPHLWGNRPNGRAIPLSLVPTPYIAGGEGIGYFIAKRPDTACSPASSLWSEGAL